MTDSADLQEVSVHSERDHLIQKAALKMASALRGSVAQTLQIVNKTLTQQRASVISGPPKYKVPMQVR